MIQDCMSLDELDELESNFQYFWAEKGVNFLPMYKSMIERISLYAEHPNPNPRETSKEYEQVLAYI